MQALAINIHVGDVVITEEGINKTVAKISKGIFVNSILLDFKEGGWSCISKTSVIKMHNNTSAK